MSDIFSICFLDKSANTGLFKTAHLATLSKNGLKYSTQLLK